MMGDIRVLIVDDQDIVRRGLEIILNSQPGIRVVGQAADGREAIEQAQALHPDVVLMDLKMPRLSGVQATRRITEALPATQVVILTTYDTDNLVFDGVRAGAKGYLLKDAPEETIIEAVRGVMRGESQLDPGVARKVLQAFHSLPQKRDQVDRTRQPATGDELPPLEKLTRREEEVLDLVAGGLSNREIAERLSLSEGTVKNHVSNILGKLQANDRTQAVIIALKRGLVSLDD
ncbi:MAG: response regulator transcription factor [Chloroflexota bacterium]|nr:response regulator transcription factor [Chloroflexota bacterium]